MRRPAADLAAALAIVLLVAGCATTAAPLPDRVGPRATDAEVLAVFARDHDGFRTITADVKGNSPEGSFSGKLFLDREGRRMRLYAWKLGGAIAIFDLLVEGDGVRLLVPSERKLAVTTAAKFPLATLAGGGGARTVVAWGKQQAPAVVAGSSTYVLVPRKLAMVKQIVRDASGKATVEIEYFDHEALPDGRIWPRGMRARRISDPPDKAFSLEFDDIVFDAPLGAKKFEMRIPPGTETVDSVEKLRRE